MSWVNFYESILFKTIIIPRQRSYILISIEENRIYGLVFSFRFMWNAFPWKNPEIWFHIKWFTYFKPKIKSVVFCCTRPCRINCLQDIQIFALEPMTNNFHPHYITLYEAWYHCFCWNTNFGFRYGSNLLIPFRREVCFRKDSSKNTLVNLSLGEAYPWYWGDCSHGIFVNYVFLNSNRRELICQRNKDWEKSLDSFYMNPRLHWINIDG